MDREPDAIAKHYAALENEQLVRFVEVRRDKWKSEGAAEERSKIVKWLERRLRNSGIVDMLDREIQLGFHDNAGL